MAELVYGVTESGRQIALRVDEDGNLVVESEAGSQAPTSISRVVSAAASTNATSVKSSAGMVYSMSGYNANAAARYVKIYNKASAPTVGTDVPVWTEYLAPQSKFAVNLSGLPLSAGIAFAFTTGSADTDTAALTAGDILAFNLAYS